VARIKSCVWVSTVGLQRRSLPASFHDCRTFKASNAAHLPFRRFHLSLLVPLSPRVGIGGVHPWRSRVQGRSLMGSRQQCLDRAGPSGSCPYQDRQVRRSRPEQRRAQQHGISPHRRIYLWHLRGSWHHWLGFHFAMYRHHQLTKNSQRRQAEKRRNVSTLSS
jgi:hypothetical protein